MDSKSRSRLLIAIAMFLAGLLVASISFPSGKMSKEARTFDIDDRAIHVGDAREICEVLKKTGGYVALTVAGRVALSNRYQGIIQTADFNEGLRIEITPQGIVGAVARIKSPTPEWPSGFAFVEGRSRIVDRQQFRLWVRLGFDNSLLIQVNSEKPKFIYSSFKPRCSNLVVGFGYSPDRYIDGRIKVDVAWGTRAINSPTPAVRLLVFAFLAISVALFLSVGIRPRQRSQCKPTDT